MATYSFSSLKEILKHQSSQEPKFRRSPLQRTKSESGKPYEDDYVTEMFGELYFKENPSISPHSLSPLLLPLSSSSSMPDPRTLQTMIGKLKDEANHENNKSTGTHSVTENKCVYNKRSWTSKEKLLPPPISYLQLSKTGKPFVYFKLDENSGRFVRKEIRIPPRRVLAAFEENGHLKLSFAKDEEQETS